jgi:hypothetical protein
VRPSECGFVFAFEAGRGRDWRGQVQQSVMFNRGRIQVIKRGELPKVQTTKRLIRRRGVMAVSLCIVLATTSAMAQQSAGTVSETVTTRHERDVNGREVVSEKVVTHRGRTNNEERVVVETYVRSIEAGRLALSQRVNRVTTATADGSQTIEETAEPNPAAPTEPLRVVQRSVTTVRTSGNDSYVSERQVFERDANGRLVLVHKQTESAHHN